MNSVDPARIGADRSAQALGEIDPDGIDIRGEGRGRDAEADGRVQQPRPVHVEAQTAVVGQRPHLLQPLEWPDCATATIGRVLDRDECRPCRVGAALLSSGTDLIDGEDPRGPTTGRSMTLASQAGPPASDMFGCDSWSRIDGLAAVGIETEGDGVAHRA